jgi:hypothetical protein
MKNKKNSYLYTLAIFLILPLVVFLPMIIFSEGEQVYFAGGAGTQEDPYQISNCEQLQNINYNDGTYLFLSGGYYFILNNDIDCSETENWNEGGGFISIGDSSNYFIGNFDGNGHVISNLKIDHLVKTDFTGLFGKIRNSVIKNIGLENINIHGNNNVGGLAGDSDFSHIENTYTTGVVLGDGDNIGGLVGVSWGALAVPSTIVNSYSTVNVTGNNNVGGLVGYNVGDRIYNSFSAGEVSGVFGVGGLVGSINFNMVALVGEVIINSGWYKSDPNLDLKGVGLINQIESTEESLDYSETNLSSFYLPSHLIYSNTEEYPWQFGGNPWYSHTDSFPKFVEQEFPKPKRRSSGSYVNPMYIFQNKQQIQDDSEQDKACLPLYRFNPLNGKPCPFPDDKKIEENSNSINITPFNFNRTLELLVPRMVGSDIIELQNYLNSHGYDCGLIDGVFGSKMEETIKLFQLANGLTPDGKVGPKTREFMK